MTVTNLSKEDIEKIIPHRSPMLLIDEIVEMETGAWAHGRTHLRGDEFFFQGHFPGQPVLPGVIMVEALAQTGAVAILSMPEFQGKVGYFAGIDKVRFKRKVYPGETLDLKVEIIKRRGPIGYGKAEAYVDGELAVSGQLTFAVGD